MKKIIGQANFSEFAYSDIYDVHEGKDSNPLQESNTSLDYIEDFMWDESLKRYGEERGWLGQTTLYFVENEGELYSFKKGFDKLESAMVYAGWRGLSALKGDEHGNH